MRARFSSSRRFSDNESVALGTSTENGRRIRAQMPRGAVRERRRLGRRVTCASGSSGVSVKPSGGTGPAERGCMAEGECQRGGRGNDTEREQHAPE
jgi:hypothetical protein